MSKRYELMRVPVEQDRAAALRELARAEVVDPAPYEASSFDRLADTAAVTEGWTEVPIVRVDLGDEQPVGQRRRPAWPLVAAAVGVVIGVAGLALVTTNDDNDQSPAPGATVSVVPTGTVATETVSFAVKSANDILVTFTKPKSWGVLDKSTAFAFDPQEPPTATAPATAPDKNVGPPPDLLGAYSNLTQEGAWVQFAGVSNIFTNGCAPNSLLDPPVGPTVDDLVTAWANIPQLAASMRIAQITTPVDITVDGYTGKQIEFTVPDFHYPCGSGVFRYGLWYGPDPDTQGWLIYSDNARATPNRHFQMLVLDVDGTRLLIAASTDPNTPPQDRAALAELLASIQIG
jgi:hypothetical protein